MYGLKLNKQCTQAELPRVVQYLAKIRDMKPRGSWAPCLSIRLGLGPTVHPLNSHQHMWIYIYIYMFIYIHIYIFREVCNRFNGNSPQKPFEKNNDPIYVFAHIFKVLWHPVRSRLTFSSSWTYVTSDDVLSNYAAAVGWCGLSMPCARCLQTLQLIQLDLRNMWVN